MTRLSTLFLPTLKEAPADAEAISHKLMVRAGLVRQLGAGMWTYLPAGWRAHRKAEQIIREEMDAIGAHELLMPVLQPAEPRPRAGVLRTREFIMKDSYSFDRDSGGLERSYGLHANAYARIFDRS